MRSGADEEQIVEMVVAVMRAEPCALRENWFETERAAKVRAKVGAEILGGIVEGDIETITQFRDKLRLDPVQYQISISFAFDIPVNLAFAKMRDGGKRIEGGVPCRCHPAVGCTGVMKVERRVGRKLPSIVNVA